MTSDQKTGFETKKLYVDAVCSLKIDKSGPTNLLLIEARWCRSRAGWRRFEFACFPHISLSHPYNHLEGGVLATLNFSKGIFIKCWLKNRIWDSMGISSKFFSKETSFRQQQVLLYAINDAVLRRESPFVSAALITLWLWQWSADQSDRRAEGHNSEEKRKSPTPRIRGGRCSGSVYGACNSCDRCSLSIE